MFFPIEKCREGKCQSCGECCKMPYKCPCLRFDKNNKSYCSIYKLRPLSCRVYPRSKKEHITHSKCGYIFKDN